MHGSVILQYGTRHCDITMWCMLNTSYVWCRVWCLMFDVWCLMFDVWCLMLDFLYLMFGIWHSTFDVLCLMLDVWYWSFHGWCLVLDVWCFIFHVWCWMLDVGCWVLDVGRWTLDVGHLTFDVWRSTFDLMFDVWCLTCGVWRWGFDVRCLVFGVWCLYVMFDVVRSSLSMASTCCWSGGWLTVCYQDFVVVVYLLISNIAGLYENININSKPVSLISQLGSVQISSFEVKIWCWNEANLDLSCDKHLVLHLKCSA